jgi:hypothetical protein
MLIEPEAIDRAGLSAIGRDVLRSSADWTVGRSDHFLVFAGSLREVSDTVAQLEFARTCGAARLGLDTDRTDPALVALVRDDRTWYRLMRGFGLRRDSLAMQVGRELFLKEDAAQARRPDRIAHEVMHLLLSDSFGRSIPLWLDEGVAGHYGWLCAGEFAIGREAVLVRNQPALLPDQVLSLDALLNLRRYPDDEEAARAFYRQAEDLVATLADRLGDAGMVRFVHAVCGHVGDRREGFRLAAGLDDTGWDEVEAEMRRRSTTVRKP